MLHVGSFCSLSRASVVLVLFFCICTRNGLALRARMTSSRFALGVTASRFALVITASRFALVYTPGF